ncbi:MAG: hypothetical protein Q3966_04515 [Neisseria sp.]|nr:hypothetical protein [Neisseria sp.]
MMTRKTAALLLTAFCAAAQARDYRFSDYPAGKIYRGKNHKLIIPKRWKIVQEDIKKEYYYNKEHTPIGFAGNYVPAIWSCGSSCQFGVIVDARSGKAYDLDPLGTDHPLYPCYLPGNKDGEEIFQYRADSRLFITTNCHYTDLAENTSQYLSRLQHKTTYIYEWRERQKKFVLLKKTVSKSIVPSSW